MKALYRLLRGLLQIIAVVLFGMWLRLRGKAATPLPSDIPKITD